LRSFIVDASVGAKWCLPLADEELVEEAENLLEGFKTKEIGLVVPDLFWIEVANAIWKSVRRDRLSRDDGTMALSLLQGSGIPTMPSATLLPQALSIAVTYGRTVHDSLYVAMAIESSMEMVTADERLANALSAYFPVKWLGAVQI
jgi:predicted nucleic acid-binding protein